MRLSAIRLLKPAYATTAQQLYPVQILVAIIALVYVWEQNKSSIKPEL